MIWVAAFINFILILFLAISCFKKPSIMLFGLLTSFTVFIIRPFAVLMYGSTILTENFFNRVIYEDSLLIATFYNLCFYLTALIFLHKKSKKVGINKNRYINISNNYIFLNLLFCLSCILLFLYVGGLDVLFINRSASISTVAPSVRYIYPFAIIFMCVGSMQAAIVFLQNKFFIGLLLILFYLIASVIIGQRGFFIIFTIIGMSLFLRTKKIGFNSYFFSLIPIAFVLIIALFSKQIFTNIFSEDSSNIITEQASFSEEVLSSPDGDATEIWMLATTYVNQNGYLLGESIVNNIFNIVSHTQRKEWDVMNGADILNNAFTGDGYWDLGFGFNVTLPIELYINFGLFGLIPMCFIGILLGVTARSFDRKVVLYGKDPSWEVLKFYAIYTFCISLAGLQWTILFYAIYTITRFRLKLKLKYHQA